MAGEMVRSPWIQIYFKDGAHGMFRQIRCECERKTLRTVGNMKNTQALYLSDSQSFRHSQMWLGEMMLWLFTGIWKPNKIKHHYFRNWLILVEIPQIRKPFCVLREHLSSVLLRHLCHWVVTSCLLLGLSQQSWVGNGGASVLPVVPLPVSGPYTGLVCQNYLFNEWMKVAKDLV